MAETIKAGIIGLDTSHVLAFTELLNNPQAKGHVDGVKIVAAYPTSSPDIESSAGRVGEYTKTLRDKYGVKMVDSTRELLEQVDALFIESVDGRRHLPELRQVAETGKKVPIFIDKPFAASLADTREMAKILREKNLPCFSSSALRYDANMQKFLAEKGKYGKIQGCDAFSPAHLEKTNPGFFWYGVHGVEILYTVMGRGCRSVRCSSTPAGDLAVGLWSDGRIGTMRGIRLGKNDYGATVLCEKAIRDVPRDPDTPLYIGLVQAIVKFFQTGQTPVPLEDTLEIMAFIDAALRSSEQKCGDVALAL